MLFNLPELDRTISRAYLAESVQHPRFEKSFLAIWAVPGTGRDYVRLADTGEAVLFTSQREAENAAREAGYAYLNNAHRSNIKRRNERMSGPEFAASLADLPINREDFATIWGCDTDRIWSWENGRDPVPFPFWWILPELEDEALITEAVDIARLHSQPKD